MMTHRVLRNTVFTTILALALYGAMSPIAHAQGTDGSESWPDWLQQAMAQELRKPKSRKIRVGDGLFESRLPGKPMGDPQPMDGGWYVAMDIDTPSPLECWVFTTTIDPATMASNIADASIQATEATSGPMVGRSIHALDMGAIDGAPYIALEWLYTVGEAPNVNVGLTKVRVATIDETTLACGHNYLGYRESFSKLFEEFVREAEIAGERRSPEYQEIFVHRIGDQPIGVSRSSFAIDEDGDTEITMVESMLIPVDGSTLTISDKWHASFARPDGSLINQVTAKAENGVLTMQLALNEMEDGGWVVSGTLQGKDISTEIVSDSRPMSEIGQMYAVERLLADEERTDITLDAWLPEVDPTRFIRTGVKIESEGRKDGQATLTLGPMAMDAQFDRKGSLINGRMQAGASEMIVARVWSQGTPP